MANKLLLNMLLELRRGISNTKTIIGEYELIEKVLVICTQKGLIYLHTFVQYVR